VDRQQQFAKLIEDIAQQPSTLVRTPEPEVITSSENSVSDYNQVMETNMTVNYAVSLDFIYRSRSIPLKNAKAIDLCSGPGHFSICLSEYLGYMEVLGIDYSDTMLKQAKQNASLVHAQKKMDFIKGDISKLSPKDFGKVDLVSFTNAAHHLPSLEHVRRTLQFADNVVSETGIIVVTDMCRLNNQELTERFVRLAGEDYKNRGMHAMYDDFLASMYAAWSFEELATAVPTGTTRTWVQFEAAALPFFQVLIGLPEGRDEAFVRDSFAWDQSRLLKSQHAQQDWVTTKDFYYSGRSRIIRPKLKTAKAA
jgi:ubiquinone/menaquinone biosynthesis C-methylase UbiE